MESNYEILLRLTKEYKIESIVTLKLEDDHLSIYVHGKLLASDSQHEEGHYQYSLGIIDGIGAINKNS